MIRAVALMGTIVTIEIVNDGANQSDLQKTEDAIDRAFGWFRQVEACCSRFDPASELRQLTTKIGVAVPVSDMLCEAVRFAVAVAAETGGAFDPTVGQAMEARGFDRHYRTGEVVRTPVDTGSAVSYRDVHVNPKRRTITLRQPLALDLGAVAKGLAIDTAARELRPFKHFAIDAGGDLYLAGRNSAGAPWSVGIRHPRVDQELIESLTVSDQAVCTSGDYERKGRDDAGHHILDPRTGDSAASVASVTVVAPTAIVADALATAAFVLGPTEGIRLLERQGVDGFIITPSLERFSTHGMHSVR